MLNKLKRAALGAHTPHDKATAASKPIPMPLPAQVRILMSQHIGAPAKALVKKGDEVFVGTKIGEAGGFVSANIHSSVSGTVAAVEPFRLSNGRMCDSVVIKTDGKQTVDPAVKAPEVTDKASFLAAVRECGLVGLGGAGFPTDVKLQPKQSVDTLLINAAECEPYLTCDYRVMLDRTEEFVKGVKILSSCLGVARTVIGIEENKMEAYEKLRAFDGFELILLEKKYPQGGEKQLIYACCGRVVPAKALPMDVGVVVQNVATALAVYEAVEKGKPLYERVVTVSGKGVAEPKNLLVKTGTLFEEALDFCGGISEDTQKLIAGGPMMGTSLYDATGVFTKTDSGLLALTGEEANVSQPSNCISCGACARACPMNLMPMYIDFYALAGDFKTSEKYGTNHCIECGCCANVCPAKRPLVQSIRLAKAKLREKAK